MVHSNNAASRHVNVMAKEEKIPNNMVQSNRAVSRNVDVIVE